MKLRKILALPFYLLTCLFGVLHLINMMIGAKVEGYHSSEYFTDIKNAIKTIITNDWWE